MTRGILPRNIHRQIADVFLSRDGHDKKNHVGTVISYEDGSFELSLAVHPFPGSTLVFDIPNLEDQTNTPKDISAIVSGPISDFTTTVGSLNISHGVATAQFFAQANNDARIVF